MLLVHQNFKGRGKESCIKLILIFYAPPTPISTYRHLKDAYLFDVLPPADIVFLFDVLPSANIILYSFLSLLYIMNLVDLLVCFCLYLFR